MVTVKPGLCVSVCVCVCSVCVLCVLCVYKSVVCVYIVVVDFDENCGVVRYQERKIKK